MSDPADVTIDFDRDTSILDDRLPLMGSATLAASSNNETAATQPLATSNNETAATPPLATSNNDAAATPPPATSNSETVATMEELAVEEDDKESLEQLVSWLSGKVEILPSKIRRYASQFVGASVGSIKRLAKKIRKTPDFLESLGIHIDDADEISEVLSREGVYEAVRLEKLAAQQADEAESVPREAVAPPVVTLLQTRQRASSSATAMPPLPESMLAPLALPPISDILIRSRQGTMGSEAELPGYLSNPYAYTYTNDHPDDDVQQGGGGRARKHSSYYATRKLSDAKLDVMAAEVAELLMHVKQSVDGEDEIATMGALMNVSDAIEGSQEKQRAFHRAFAHLVVLDALRKLSGSTGVATEACRVMALLCRCGDDKGSTSYENCKALGLSNASEAVVTAFKKHADDGRLVESACDAIRSLCCLESNKERLGEAGACEVIAGAIANFSADPTLCAWVCRAMGHLAQGCPANQEAFGDSLCAANLIIALQHHQKNDMVCTEVRTTRLHAVSALAFVELTLTSHILPLALLSPCRSSGPSATSRTATQPTARASTPTSAPSPSPWRSPGTHM